MAFGAYLPLMRSPSPTAERADQLIALRRARPLLGTRVEIEVNAALPSDELHAAIDAAFAAIESVQRLMSYHDVDSELSRLNRTAAQVTQRIDAHTWRVFECALHMAAISDGAFDPCIGAALESWGFLPRHAASQNATGCWRDVELLEGSRVRFRRALRIDLGGIAKGYAVDLALQALHARGVRDAIVNAGGDLRVAGERVHMIAIRQPQAPALLSHSMSLHDAALATSAGYYSRRELAAIGEVCALIDPRDGQALRARHSVSVRSARCMDADALTKVVLFAPTGLAQRVLAAYDACAYLSAAAP